MRSAPKPPPPVVPAKFRFGFTCELAMNACVTSLMVLTETTPPMPTSPPEILIAESVSPFPLGFGTSAEFAQTSTSPLMALTDEFST